MMAVAQQIATTTETRRPKLAFVGLGWIGTHRLHAIASSGMAEIAALCDVRRPEEIEDLDAPFLTSFDELLTNIYDGVVIATPNAFHAEQAIAALERGMNVFSQKPLGR